MASAARLAGRRREGCSRADFNCPQLPKGTEHETDFAMLTDIFPTGYHATAQRITRTQ